MKLVVGSIEQTHLFQPLIAKEVAAGPHQECLVQIPRQKQAAGQRLKPHLEVLSKEREE
jgi:hypothetical protein